MTIDEAAGLLRSHQITCLELTDQALQKAERLNPKLNMFITITADQARESAKGLDDDLAHGHDRGRLHGIPIAHKDLICTKGVRTTSGSKLFADYVPDYNATVVEQLETAGAVSIGKLGLHELAYGITSANPHFGPVCNPFNAECIPGGSSGGSGAAVATSVVFMATGTDTGGSIRIPAAYCGTVGFKPTYGLVSRYGVRPLGFSLDHVGPLTRTVRDAELVMQAIAKLPTATVPEQPRIGVPENFFFEKLDPEVKASVEAAVHQCETLGAHLVPVRVPDVQSLNAVALIILLAEASAALENHLSQRDQFGPDVLALLDQGRLISATEYINAQRLRKQFVTQFRQLFEQIDLLITPTLPITAPKIGQATVELDGETMDARMATTRFMRGFNALGLPALSIPCGLSSARMPIGVQLIGRVSEDNLVLRFGQKLQDVLGLKLEPPISFGS